MGITLSLTCMYPKEMSRAKAPTFIVPLCAQGVPFQEGKMYKQIAEKIMEEQLVMALVSPKTTVQTCLHKCLHYWGIDG